jgi:hypothetical protein
MKDYIVTIELKFTHYTEAENKKRAIEIVKDSFKEDYDITLTNEEIKSVLINK